ncbi:MAG: glycosyltransferase family A protein [Bacteroidota bacterium]
MLFSIIIPTYNRAHLIEKTIESVLNQTYSNFEVIIIDNYSTDDTLEVLKKYSHDMRFKVIASDKNYERSRSRNVGMNNAKGNYLTFLDSDDLMQPTCLNDAYEFAIKNQEVEIFHNKYQFCYHNNEIINTFQDKPNHNKPLNAILKGNFLACIGVFINERLYKNHKFLEDVAIIGSEDWLFWIQIISDTKKLGFINKVNSFIVEHSERTENNRNPFEFEKQILFLKNIVINQIKLNKIEIKLFELSTNFLIANDYCDFGEKKIAFKKLKELLKKYPSYFFNIKILNLIKNILLK